MRLIRIASRGSKLALAQTEIVRKLLQSLDPTLEVSLFEISTKGDRDRSDFLHKAVSVGFFTSEAENAVSDGRADLAVHSLKDLPTAITPGLTVAAIPKRESPADALVTSAKIASITDLPSGAKIGTSSLRRIAQLKRIRQDLQFLPMRGNVETRVAKVESGQVHAAVLAFAGLNRLGLSEKISMVLPPQEFIPAPAQGALAIQTRTEDTDLIRMVALLDDKNTRIAVEAERSILAAMHGGCSIPLGAHAETKGDAIAIHAMLSDLEGIKCVKNSLKGNKNQSQALARKLAQQLLDAGGKEILQEIRRG